MSLSPDHEQMSERDELILNHMGMVRAIARRIQKRLPRHVPFDDLVSAGIIGLVQAVDYYDPSQGTQLSTYANVKVRGAILDSLRKEDGLTRQRRKRHRQIEEAIAGLQQKLARVPEDEEVAAALGLPLDVYYEWQGDAQGIEISSGDADSDVYENMSLFRLVADDRELPSVLVERQEMESMLSEEIQALPVLERTVLSLYCEREMTPQEIAQVVDIKSTRISQLRCQAISRLRTSLQRRLNAHKTRS